MVREVLVLLSIYTVSKYARPFSIYVLSLVKPKHTVMKRIFELTEVEFRELIQQELHAFFKKRELLEKGNKKIETKNNEFEDLLRASEAASLLGIKVSYLYQLKTKSKIPYVKTAVGGLRFSRKELIKWMDCGRPDIIKVAVDSIMNR